MTTCRKNVNESRLCKIHLEYWQYPEVYGALRATLLMFVITSNLLLLFPVATDPSNRVNGLQQLTTDVDGRRLTTMQCQTRQQTTQPDDPNRDTPSSVTHDTSSIITCFNFFLFLI